MTPEESDANEKQNERIRHCRHKPYAYPSGAVYCAICDCQFAAMLKPVLQKMMPIADDEEE